MGNPLFRLTAAAVCRPVASHWDLEVGFWAGFGLVLVVLASGKERLRSALASLNSVPKTSSGAHLDHVNILLTLSVVCRRPTEPNKRFENHTSLGGGFGINAVARTLLTICVHSFSLLEIIVLTGLGCLRRLNQGRRFIRVLLRYRLFVAEPDLVSFFAPFAPRKHRVQLAAHTSPR